MASENDAPKPDLVEAVSESNTTQESNYKTPPVLNTEGQIPPSMADTNKAYQEKEHRLNGKRFWVEVLTLCAVVFYGWVAYRQWGEMEKSTLASKKSADAAKVGADQAKRAADIAEATQKSVDESSRLEQRAWVGPTDGRLSEPFTPQSKTQVSIVFMNSGKTPALSFSVRTLIELMPQGEKPKIDVPLKPKSSTDPAVLVLHPGAITINNSNPLTMNETQLNTMKDGSNILYIHGVYSYEDIFRRKWGGTYCMYISPDLKEIRFCSFGNTTHY